MAARRTATTVLASLCALAIASAPAAEAAGTYTIVAPRVIRPNTDFSVAVTTQGTGQPTSVTLEVAGRQDSGGVITQRVLQTIMVEPFATRTARLEIPDLGSGHYRLTARGQGGVNFENATDLQYVHKSYSVFIQTDKAIYKPGHTVQFRVLALNANLKPSVTQPLDIFISDGKGHRVKEWKRVPLTRGVFSGELPLSESPVLGDWNITAAIQDQMFTENFQVAEYVLPNFEVTADVADFTTYKEGKIAAVIRARYTYGKPVRGEATVTAYPTYFSDVLQPIFQPPVRKVVPIDGKAAVEFDLEKELKLQGDFTRDLQLDVTVEEAHTLRRQNITKHITVHKYKYTLELIRSSKYFKPGLKYSAWVKVAHHDGTPVQDDINPVTFRYGYTWDTDKYLSFERPLPRNGIVKVEFYPPSDAVTLGIEARYLDLTEWFSTIDAALSPSSSFVQAVLVTQNPKVNEDVEIEVNSTSPLSHLSYQVLGRGDIVVAHSIPLSGQRATTFRFLATHPMAPSARVLIHSVLESGEVVADVLDVELEGLLQNFVDLTLNPTTTEPGRDVELRLQTRPNSYIGILAVDQSVLVLRDGNDVTEQDVKEELRSYSPDPPTHEALLAADAAAPRGRALRLRRRAPGWRPGSATAQEVFDNAGTVILTNGVVMESVRVEYYSRGLPSPVMDSDSPFASIKAAPDAGDGGADATRTRRHFPETWLWEQVLDSGSDGRASIKRTVPDSITSWVVSAFSVDPLYGLGLTPQPSKLTVFRPFFVSVDLPYSVIRGEVVSIPIVVFNYMNQDARTDVTLEHAGDLEFAEVSNEINAEPAPKLELYRRKKVTVRAQDTALVSFMVIPRELGYITIKVSASSDRAGDIVERRLLVKPEGETVYRNKAILVDLRGSNSFKTNVTLHVPKYIVPGSERIEVSAVGDILGPSIPNLDSLIRMPHGCGEQNMLNFVPNVVILDYLKNSRQLSQAVESRARGFMEKGYQQQLTYRHKDGSFSAFGETDPSGSTWLTAFVARAFRQGQAYIPLEERVVDEALQWLAEHQATNGSFPEEGKVIHSDMQGGAGRGLALTAYVLTTFLYNQQFTSKYRNTINKAVDYLVRNIGGVEDPYAIAVTTYALHLALHPTKEAAFNLLESKAHSNSTRAQVVEQDGAGGPGAQPLVHAAQLAGRGDDLVRAADVPAARPGQRGHPHHALAGGAAQRARRLRRHPGHGAGHAGAGLPAGAHLGAARQRGRHLLVPRGRRPGVQHQHQPRQLDDPAEAGGAARRARGGGERDGQRRRPGAGLVRLQRQRDGRLAALHAGPAGGQELGQQPPAALHLRGLRAHARGQREQHGGDGGVAAVRLHGGPRRAAQPRAVAARAPRRDQGAGHRRRALLRQDGAQGVLPHGVGLPHAQGGAPAPRARHRLRLLRPVAARQGLLRAAGGHPVRHLRGRGLRLVLLVPKGPPHRRASHGRRQLRARRGHRGLALLPGHLAGLPGHGGRRQGARGLGCSSGSSRSSSRCSSSSSSSNCNPPLQK